jgi:hypothetical protein
MFAANFLLLSALLISSITAHVAVTHPPPRNVYSPDTNSPASKLCKGFPKGHSVLTIAAGSTLQVSYTKAAPHGGGGCVFSLSYDGGQTFQVFAKTDRSCPIVPSKIVIPQSAKNGEAVLAWSWVPLLSGQPEYYMNCIDITITNGSGGFYGPALPIYNMPGYPKLYSADPAKFVGLSDIVKV